jgi:hypothetical protein
LTPAQYPDFAALRGDPSDNLPGIPGVGEKTAAKWVREFGSFDALVAGVDTVKGKVGDALRDMKRWALFAMREDHVAALDPYLRPIPTRLKSTFRLDLLNTAGARVAVHHVGLVGAVRVGIAEPEIGGRVGAALRQRHLVVYVHAFHCRLAPSLDRLATSLHSRIG